MHLDHHARLLRRFLAALSVAALAGCAHNQPSYVDERSIDPDGLYDGEPVALHATEIPITSSTEARTRARAALTQGDMDLALYFYVQAVTLEPSDTESLYAIGAIHENRGNFDLAARAFAGVCAIEPDNALALQGLGIAHFDARRFAEAEAPLQKAVEIDGSLWRAHNTLGILADRRDQYDVAVEHYTLAIQAQPTIASIRNNRGYSKYLSGDLEAAKRDFLAALDIDPEFERAWQNIGLIYAREKDYPRALRAMTFAIPEYVALNDIGYIAMLDGNYQIAQTYFDKAIMASPRHYQTAQDNLAELQRRRSGGTELLAVEVPPAE